MRKQDLSCFLLLWGLVRIFVCPLAVKVACGTLWGGGGKGCFIDLLASFIDLLASFIDLLASFIDLLARFIYLLTRFIDLLARFIDLLARVSQDPHCSTIYLVLTHL